MAAKSKQEREEARLRRFSTVEPKAVDWIWYPYLPAKLTYVFGMPGTGNPDTAVAQGAAILANTIKPERVGGLLPDDSAVSNVKISAVISTKPT